MVPTGLLYARQALVHHLLMAYIPFRKSRKVVLCHVLTNVRAIVAQDTLQHCLLHNLATDALGGTIRKYHLDRHCIHVFMLKTNPFLEVLIQNDSFSLL